MASSMSPLKTYWRASTEKYSAKKVPKIVKGKPNENRLSWGADFVIKPKHDNLHWSAFDKTDKFIEAGEFAAENAINNLLEELENIVNKPKETKKETFWTRIKKRLFS